MGAERRRSGARSRCARSRCARRLRRQPPPRQPNPIVATVNGQDIHLSELSEMTRNLPQQLQGMSPQQLYPILLDQLVDQKAMAIVPRSTGC